MNPAALIATGRFAGYVVAAYAVTGAGLATLTVWSLVASFRWKRRADRAAARRSPR